MDKIFEEIRAEREYQKTKKFYSAEIDDKWTNYEWVTFITHYATKYFFSFDHKGNTLFRTSMIKVAALAVAAIESFDRKYK